MDSKPHHHPPTPEALAVAPATHDPFWAPQLIALFALWFWELDRGGPLVRATQSQTTPDFLFVPMTEPHHAPRD